MSTHPYNNLSPTPTCQYTFLDASISHFPFFTLSTRPRLVFLNLNAATNPPPNEPPNDSELKPTHRSPQHPPRTSAILLSSTLPPLPLRPTTHLPHFFLRTTLDALSSPNRTGPRTRTWMDPAACLPWPTERCRRRKSITWVPQK